MKIPIFKGSAWPISVAKKADLAVHNYATHFVAALIAVVGITGMMMFYRLYKGSVQNLHAWLGMAFLLSIALHVTRNRRQLVSLFAHKRMHVLLVMTAAIAACFVYLSPTPKANPAKSLTKAVLRTPLVNLVPVLGITPELALARMHAAGVDAPALDQSIEYAAQHSHSDPAALLAAVLSSDKKNHFEAVSQR